MDVVERIIKNTDTATALAKRTVALPDFKQQEVMRLRAQALTYVWGWQDRGGYQDSYQADEFALAYWEHALAYAEEKSGCRTDLRTAFVSWLGTGEIRS